MKTIPAIEGGKVTRNNFLPFARPLIEKEDIEEVVDTLNSDWLTTGPKTHLFEEEFAKYIGCKYAVAVNSCTAALHISLAALGIGKGDEVITTPYTFVSTVNVILQQGAMLVLVDIKPDTFNINPDLIRKKINDKTKALIPVHFGGQPCEMGKIMKIAKDNNLLVIEDAAHAISAEYEGRKIGTIGDATCFSFYPTKNMTTGEGGMVTTNDEKLRERLKIWGSGWRWWHPRSSAPRQRTRSPAGSRWSTRPQGRWCFGEGAWEKRHPRPHGCRPQGRRPQTQRPR